MSIVSLGLDLTQIERLAEAEARRGARFLERLFTAGERAYCERRAARRHVHYAGRFAVKEAVLKAFGTGLGQRMRWTEVEVINEPLGRPRVELHGEVARWAERRRVTAVEVSLSHAAGLAVAQAAVQLDG